MRCPEIYWAEYRRHSRLSWLARRLIMLSVVLPLLIAGCANGVRLGPALSRPEVRSPAVRGMPAPDQPTAIPPSASPAMAVSPSVTNSSADSHPVVATTVGNDGRAWQVDAPKSLTPLAFGKLPPVDEPGPRLAIDSVVRSTSFPTVPAELPVYEVADCQYLSRSFPSTVQSATGWTAIPGFCLVQYRGERPFGDRATVADQKAAERQARALLVKAGLWMPDNRFLSALARPDGGWTVRFAQTIDGIPVDANKGPTVSLDNQGQATDIIERRRPLLASSLYPIRAPEDAWQLVRAGRWQTFYLGDGAPSHAAHLTRFVVQTVELVYLEPEVTAPRELIQPFYAFRGTGGSTLCVPAVDRQVVNSP